MESITRNAERKVAEKPFPNADAAIEQAKEKGEAVWEKAKAKGRDLLEEVESKGLEWGDQVKKFFQKSPVRAIGYTLAAGIVIGALLARKRD